MSAASFTLLALISAAQAQPESPAEPSPERVVLLWFERMSALDGSEEAAEALASLYKEDALHIDAPEAHQLGAVTYRGHDSLRVMAGRLTERYEEIRYRPDVVTARESSETLFHVTEGPWGDASVAVSFSLARTRKSDGIRLMVPGAAFFQLEGERVRRVRVYLARGEEAEVER